MPGLSTILDAVAAYLQAALATPQQVAAHVAAAAALALAMAGALMRTMMPLRWLAAASNLGLLVYGVLHPAPTTAAVAALLLPVNLVRAVEVTRLARRVRRAAADADHVGLWLRPHMKRRRLRAGQVLFHQGDAADHLYLLVSGRLVLDGIGVEIAPGRIFGEIALFSPSGLRTQTVRAAEPCLLLQIHESTVRQLYYQNPAFAFHLVGLLAAHLSDDVARAEGQAAAVRAAATAATAPPPAPA